MSEETEMTRMLTKLFPLAILFCIGVSSCGGGKEKDKPTSPDEQLIQQMIQEWIAFLEAGDGVSLETFFDPTYWTESPTRTRLSEFTGGSLSASSVLVGVEGKNATAAFTLDVAGDESMSVIWDLQKTGDKWLIYYEDWTS
jgi:hypothetical protein